MTDTILLVDDDVTVLNAHARLLEPLAAVAPWTATLTVSIQMAESGAAAEAYLVEQPHCAVVVSDLRMP